ncbi:hypothetical protein [Azoarcus olearius]|uniref:Hypothetical secreted protein n=1 Tax=Azoarcus sp. (strain BH72) TaxID=418699 RepID=A1K9Z3_AZOSB|nr:hypothetical protein [Azoarcus olearius]CAL95648.1 hypothetical secreted protein [Azoarcus olearius]
MNAVQRALAHAIPFVLGLACLPAGAAEDFRAFHSRFRAAIVRNDAAGLAQLTRLPFLLEGRQLDRDAFVRTYPVVFTPALRHCLAAAPVATEGSDKTVHCPPYSFYFRVDGGRWLLAGFGADGEDAQ